MSWSIGAKRADFAAAVGGNFHTPKDGRLETAAEALCRGFPEGSDLMISTNGHLEADGSGSCAVSVQALPVVTKT